MLSSKLVNLGLLILSCLSLFLTDTSKGEVKSEAEKSKKELKIYAYRSFVSEWGPGTEIRDSFQAICDCRLTWVPAQDGAALWGRIKMEGPAFDGDVVLGLDSHLAYEVGQSGLLEDFGHPDFSQIRLPEGAWFDKGSGLVPFQFGYYAIMYDTNKIKAFDSWDSLVEKAPPRSLILQDPRTSTVGLGFLSWTKSQYKGDWDTFMKKLRPKILTVAKGWSDAYGLFLKGEAPMVMSYSLSEAYHIVSEKKSHLKAMIFPGGHPLQVEGAGVVKKSRQKELARQFVAFLLRPSSQKILATKSWMYPVRNDVEGLPHPFTSLKQPKLLPGYSMKDLGLNRTGWVKAWTENMTALW